jgi:hypothetical protein
MAHTFPIYLETTALCAKLPGIPGGCVMRRKGRQFPIYVEYEGQKFDAKAFASAEDKAADVSITVRSRGWYPFRARFDGEQQAWIVSTLGPNAQARVR